MKISCGTVMQKSFEEWWDNQRMLATEYEYESTVFGPKEKVSGYLNDGNNEDSSMRKAIAWIAWQGAFEHVKEMISV